VKFFKSARIDLELGEVGVATTVARRDRVFDSVRVDLDAPTWTTPVNIASFSE
jgi:hypothetical protein